MKTDQETQFDGVILWIDKPLFRPYLINHIFSYKSTIQVLIIGLTISFTGNVLYKSGYDWNGLFFFVAILCVAGILQILLKIVSYQNIKYWITKDAVYIQTGVFKPTVMSILKDKIRYIDIEKSSEERQHGAGTVIIDDGELKKGDLEEEYKIYKKLIAVKDPEKSGQILVIITINSAFAKAWLKRYLSTINPYSIIEQK